MIHRHTLCNSILMKQFSSRDLSFNDLRDWKVNHTNELQELKKLDMTGNEHWLPSKQLLVQLSNLTTMEVRLSQYCQNCSLCNVNFTSSCSRDRSRLRNSSDWPWNDKIQYGRALYFFKLGFWPRCLADVVCRTDQFVLPYLTSIYGAALKLSFALYVTGSVALLVNIAVVVFIVLHKSIRNDLAVQLLLNVALCDVLIVLASIRYPRFNFAEMRMKHLLDVLQGNNPVAFFLKWKKVANIMGPILTCAVFSQVFGSGISMLDKFFKIVFAMKPAVRLGRKTAVALLVVSWSLSGTFAVLPLFGIGGMTYTDRTLSSSLPVDPPTHDDGKLKNTTGFAFGSQIALVIVQLASFLLYIPIFIVAKKSGANVGVKREAAIARKIALLVCTNIIFFTAPIVIVVFQGAVLMNLVNDTNDDWRSHTLADVQWTLFLLQIFPVLCFSINSLLNPFLYALRHPKVKQQLNPLLCRCWATIRECFGTLRQNLRYHTANEEPINTEAEMQEGRNPQSASLPGEENDEVQSQLLPPQCPSHPNNWTTKRVRIRDCRLEAMVSRVGRDTRIVYQSNPRHGLCLQRQSLTAFNLPHNRTPIGKSLWVLLFWWLCKWPGVENGQDAGPLRILNPVSLVCLLPGL